MNKTVRRYWAETIVAEALIGQRIERWSLASFKGKQVGGGRRRASRSVCLGVVENTVLTDLKKGRFFKQQACGYGDTERLCTSRNGMAQRGSSQTVDEVCDLW